MDFKHHDSFSYYKKIESEMNKRIHDTTNSRTFTLAFGRAMEAHLKKLRFHKRVTTRWLKRLDLANKDEIAALSNRIVDCEGKIDHMDETVYLISKIVKKNQIQLFMIRESWDEWFTFLNSEIREMHGNKINTLKKDLLELQQLFTNEFDVEDIDND